MLTAMYVDVENPKSRELLQTFEEDVPFIILSGGEIKHGNITHYLDFSEELLKILSEGETLIRPLQAKGIKILLSIKGGNGGVSFGSLWNTTLQKAFAQECCYACWLYGFDGVEFYDMEGDNPHQSPYPGVQYMTNMLIYLVEMFDKQISFAPPILIRETGYGKYISL